MYTNVTTRLQSDAKSAHRCEEQVLSEKGGSSRANLSAPTEIGKHLGKCDRKQIIILFEDFV
jgi:hypothetical protein